MSVTVYVEGAFDRDYQWVKVYAQDEFADCYDSASFESDPFYSKDEQGYFRMDKQFLGETYPTVSFGYGGSDRILSRVFPGKDLDCDQLSRDELKSAFQVAFKLLNNQKQKKALTESPQISGNTIFGGVSDQLVNARCHELLDLMRFAVHKQVGIYWG